MTYLKIPSHVTSIGDDAFSSIKDKLTSIIVKKENGIITDDPWAQLTQMLHGNHRKKIEIFSFLLQKYIQIK